MIGLVIGVDAGGSRTRVIIADASGETVATSEREGSAVKPGDIERSASIIAAAVRDALSALDPTLGAPRALCAGVAGVGREKERRALSEALLNESLADDVLVVTDAEIALADAFGDEAGIVLIAGTGSIAHGRGPTGILERVGGWGPHIGDEGGGYWIARRALSVVTAATDGREPETSLVGAMLTAAELDEVESLIPWAASATVSQIAALAPVVVASAEAGDLRANALLGLAAEELVLHVRTLARSLFEDERAAMQVALGGGLLEPGSALRRRVEHRLKSAVPGGKMHAAPIVAVRGAVRRAMHVGEPAAYTEGRIELKRSPRTVSQRSMTAVARQFPTRLIDVRAMSITASTPRMTATPCERQTELRQRARENHERCPGHGRNAFAREHERHHHEQLRLESACRCPRPAPRTPTRQRGRACSRRG